MTLETLGSVVGILGAFSVILFGFVKLWPERNRIIVESAAVSVRMASDDRDHFRADLKALRDEFDQYRADANGRMAELVVELRGERAEKKQLAEENATLKNRVAALEHEVARLKARDL